MKKLVAGQDGEGAGEGRDSADRAGLAQMRMARVPRESFFLYSASGTSTDVRGLALAPATDSTQPPYL